MLFSRLSRYWTIRRCAGNRWWWAAGYCAGWCPPLRNQARVFGIHSAMPMGQALRLCPHAVVMPVRMERYHGISRQIMTLLAGRTPLCEQVSVDEAYLDLTGCLPAGGSAETVARTLQAEIFQATGLTSSFGVAAGKASPRWPPICVNRMGWWWCRPGKRRRFSLHWPSGSCVASVRRPSEIA